MAIERRKPVDVARALAARGQRTTRAKGEPGGAWRRETYTMPRTEAREKAREWFTQFPKAAYMTEIESWRELADGRIEFTMRRLPTAD